MWMVLAYVGVGLLGTTAVLGSAILVRNPRRRKRLYRMIRRGSGKAMIGAANKQMVRNRRKLANSEGWKAGAKAMFPWVATGFKAGSQARRDAKAKVLHPPHKARAGTKPGPKTTSKPGPGGPSQDRGPKQLNRHSVILDKKPGTKTGTGHGTGHRCGAKLKADPKRHCRQPVECADHGPKCTKRVHCHWHQGRGPLS